MDTVYCFVLNKETGDLQRYEVDNIKKYLGYSRGCDINKDGRLVRYYYKENQMDTYMNGKVFSRNPDYTVVRNTILSALEKKVQEKKHELAIAKEVYSIVKQNFES